MANKHPITFSANKIRIIAKDDKRGTVFDATAHLKLISNGYVVDIIGQNDQGEDQIIVLFTDSMVKQIKNAIDSGDLSANH